MGNSGFLDISKLVDEAGLDEVVANERTRATRTPVTLTGTAALGSAYNTNQFGTIWMNGFGPPRTASTAVGLTFLAADLMTGLITIKNTTAGTLTMTLDTAANLVSAWNSVSAGAAIGDVIQCLVINSTGSTGGGTLTIANGSGGTFDANQSAPIVNVGASRYLFIRFTNVTGGSEAYQTYT